jgi:hypothetical protein
LPAQMSVRAEPVHKSIMTQNSLSATFSTITYFNGPPYKEGFLSVLRSSSLNGLFGVKKRSCP